MCKFFLNRHSCCVNRGQGKLFCLRNLTYCPGFKRAKSYCIYILYDDNFLTCHKMVWSKYTRKYKPHRYITSTCSGNNKKRIGSHCCQHCIDSLLHMHNAHKFIKIVFANIVLFSHLGFCN